MTLEQFLSEEHARLNAFADWWRAEAKELPNQFPLDLTPGEWGEQILTFQEPFDGGD